MDITTKHKIQYTIAKINQRIEWQLNCILAASELQNLSALWLNLAFLCQASRGNSQIAIKFLNISWAELDKDLNVVGELDNSILFRLLFDAEFGASGGEPFNVLLGQYQLNLINIQQISTLNSLAELCAFSLVPFVSNISPEILSESNFNAVDNVVGLIKDAPLMAWQRFRQHTHAQFINLCLPEAHVQFTHYHKEFNHLINQIPLYAATILLSRIIDSYQETNWFSEILGFFPQNNLQKRLNTIYPDTIVQLEPSLSLTHEEEQAFIHQGWIPLLKNQHTNEWYFPSAYSSYASTETVQILLENILCACRLGHHVKILGRLKIGSYANEHDCEQYLNNWLQKYTARINNAEQRYHYPLKNYQVTLHKIPGKAGVYNCQILLEPHMRLEQLNSQIILRSEIINPN